MVAWPWSKLARSNRDRHLRSPVPAPPRHPVRPVLVRAPLSLLLPLDVSDHDRLEFIRGALASVGNGQDYDRLLEVWNRYADQRDEQFRSELQRLRDLYEECTRALLVSVNEKSALHTENDELVRVLGWYACKDNWDGHPAGYEWGNEAELDKGLRARVALGKGST